ncbi:MAG TPA: ABC transporter permease [Solirubrobacteraceae bacterium]|nr:ABC transporter permease [Solirubrobacteraceae bacterium]
MSTAGAAVEAIRRLLGKDLVILRRSRLLVGVLVVYPVAIALLIGLALSRSPAKPTVALVDETLPGQTIEVGGQRVPVSAYAGQLLGQVQARNVDTRAEAIAQVQSGRALAAVVIPRDIVARIESGFRQGTLEVLYNGDALEQSLVRSELNSALAQANLGFSEEIQRAASQAIGHLLAGGNLGELGGPANAVGLHEVPGQLRAIIARQPPGADRSSLERIERLASYAAQNLSLARDVLSTVGQPIHAESRLLQGRRTPLSSFAVVVAVSVSLMFVCVLLAAGSLALEREEGVLARLARGLVSREALICEKLALAGGCALVLSLAMLAGIGVFVSLDWGRFGQWLLALVFGALAFASLGVAIGALARDVRAASLLAFLLSLPLAFLALVPSGAVASGLYDVIEAISFVFPFKAALGALDAAVNGAAPSIAASLAHLIALTALFSVLARVGLRRLE